MNAPPLAAGADSAEAKAGDASRRAYAPPEPRNGARHAMRWVPAREVRDERERKGRTGERRWKARGREKRAVRCGGGPAVGAARRWRAGHQREEVS